MYPYFLVLLAIYFLSVVSIPYRKHLIFLIFFVFSAVRFDVGFDFNTYYEVISNPNHIEYYRFGIVDRALIDVSRILGFEQFYFIATSLIINYLIFKTLLKYSSNFFISALIFFAVPIFYFYSFSIIRQFVAIAIVFYSIRYVIDKKLLFFIGTIIMASIFHASALVTFPIYFIGSKRFSNGLLFFMSISVIIVPTIMKEGIVAYLPYYSHYLTSEDGSGWMMMYLLLIFFAFVNIKSNTAKNSREVVYHNSYVLGLFLYCFFIQFGDVAPRISYYYLIFIALLIPEVLNKYKKKQIIPLVYFLFFMLFVVNFYFFDKNAYKNPYLPYEYFWAVDIDRYIWK